MVLTQLRNHQWKQKWAWYILLIWKFFEVQFIFVNNCEGSRSHSVTRAKMVQNIDGFVISLKVLSLWDHLVSKDIQQFCKNSEY